VVFVEVKTRSSDEAQDVQESLTAVKWARIERAARHFLARHANADFPCRFDVVTVLWPRHGRAEIEHFVDAHQPVRQRG